MSELAIINARPLVRPQYRNDRIRDFKLWYVDNLKALEEYFNALSPYVQGEPLEDFFSFAVTTHEVELMHLLDRGSVTECSICRRQHGPEVVHASE